MTSFPVAEDLESSKGHKMKHFITIIYMQTKCKGLPSAHVTAK